MKNCLKGVFVAIAVIGMSVSVFAERIIFVGDSITGQGQNRKGAGWGDLVRKGLEKTSDQKGSDVILLGGSGQSVGSWKNIVKQSQNKERKKPLVMDDRKYKVNEEFDKGADKLIIMLGMNDVIGPYVTNDEKGIDNWVERYKTLISMLKERVKPKQIGLATITMHTEDPASYKSRLTTKMNQRIIQLAAENGYLLMPTADEYRKVFDLGRFYKPDFHIAYDYIHPSVAGHYAIATGMLEGLGKPKAAEYIRENYINKLPENLAKGEKGLSYRLIHNAKNVPGKPNKFIIETNAYNFKDSKKVEIEATVPQGWTVEPAKLRSGGAFTVIGNPDKLKNIVTLSAKVDGKEYKRDVIIAAPWLICWGIKQSNWPYNKPLNVEKTITDIDKAIEAGQDFLKVPQKAGVPAPKWQLYYPNFNYSGKADPNSVDYAAVSGDRNYDAGYGVRKIYSPKDQKAQLNMSYCIIGNIFLTVWLNGKKVFQEGLRTKKGRKASVEIELKKGWNTLVYKSNHLSWLWQNSVGVEAPDLRYGIPGGPAK